MTFIYEPDPYSLEKYRMCEYKLATSRLSKVTVWQTDSNYLPYPFAGSPQTIVQLQHTNIDIYVTDFNGFFNQLNSQLMQQSMYMCQQQQQQKAHTSLLIN